MTEQEWLISDNPQRLLSYLADRPRDGTIRGGVVGPPFISDRKLRLFSIACCELAGLQREAAEWISDSKAGDFQAAFNWAMGWAGDQQTPSSSLRTALLREIVGNPFRLSTLCGVTDGITRPSDCFTPHCPNCAAIRTSTVLSLAAAAYAERGGRVCGRCGGRGEVQVEYDIGTRAHDIRWKPCPSCRSGRRIEDGSLDVDRLAVLADALEDAGSDCVELLNHLRGLERCSRCFGTMWNDTGHPKGPIPCAFCGTGWIPKRSPCVRGCWVLDLILGK